jgi:predicted MPP superfamily phosphohydrolase
VRFPFIGAPVHRARHTEDTARGYAIAGERVLILSRGYGEVVLPARLGAPPQIMLVRVSHGETANVRPLSR